MQTLPFITTQQTHNNGVSQSYWLCIKNLFLRGRDVLLKNNSVQVCLHLWVPTSLTCVSLVALFSNLVISTVYWVLTMCLVLFHSIFTVILFSGCYNRVHFTHGKLKLKKDKSHSICKADTSIYYLLGAEQNKHHWSSFCMLEAWSVTEYRVGPTNSDGYVCVWVCVEILFILRASDPSTEVAQSTHIWLSCTHSFIYF